MDQNFQLPTSNVQLRTPYEWVDLDPLLGSWQSPDAYAYPARTSHMKSVGPMSILEKRNKRGAEGRHACPPAGSHFSPVLVRWALVFGLLLILFDHFFILHAQPAPRVNRVLD